MKISLIKVIQKIILAAVISLFLISIRYAIEIFLNKILGHQTSHVNFPIFIMATTVFSIAFIWQFIKELKSKIDYSSEVSFELNIPDKQSVWKVHKYLEFLKYDKVFGRQLDEYKYIKNRKICGFIKGSLDVTILVLENGISVKILNRPSFFGVTNHAYPYYLKKEIIRIIG